MCLVVRGALLGVTLCLAGCGDQAQKMRDRQKRLEAERQAFQKAEEAKRKAAAPKVEPAVLEPFWGDASYLRVATGRPCPDGLGALFPAPGAARDDEAIARLRAATFVTVLSHGNGVTLRPYRAKKKSLTVEVEGVVECYDSAGLLTVAWGEPAKPYRQPSDDEEEDLVAQSVWRARPLRLPLPFPSAAEAKRFTQGDGLGTEVRLVYRLGRVDVDTKIKQAPPSADPGAAAAEPLDWGAGRLVHVELLGVRVAVDHEKTALLETRGRRAGSERTSR